MKLLIEQMTPMQQVGTRELCTVRFTVHHAVGKMKVVDVIGFIRLDERRLNLLQTGMDVEVVKIH